MPAFTKRVASKKALSMALSKRNALVAPQATNATPRVISIPKDAMRQNSPLLTVDWTREEKIRQGLRA